MKINDIQLVNDWAQKYNWNTYRLISIEFEKDKIADDGYLQVIFLGLGIYIHFLESWEQHDR